MRKLMILGIMLCLCGCSISIPTSLPEQNQYNIDQLLESFEKAGHQKEEADYVVLNGDQYWDGLIMTMKSNELIVYLLKDDQILSVNNHKGNEEVTYIQDSIRYVILNPEEENRNLWKYALSYYYSSDSTIIHVYDDLSNKHLTIDAIGTKDKIDEEYLTKLFYSNHPKSTVRQLLVLEPYQNYYGAALYTDENGNDQFDLIQKYSSDPQLGGIRFLEDTKLVQDGNQLFFKIKHENGKVTTQFITFEDNSISYSEKTE